MAIGDEPLLDDERLFKAMLRTPTWHRMRRKLQYRRDRAAQRILEHSLIDPQQIAADKREWQLLCQLIQDPVKFLTELDHAEELDTHRLQDAFDDDGEEDGEEDEENSL